ncbi:MAG TPA: PPC domain-containing protein [Polyangia bacterium]|nr:PPC domain-containing protein [Polyangia bacterium]
MKRASGWVGVLVIVAGCSGSQGPEGKPGPQGPPGGTGTASPSISAVTPPYAFLGRTVDVQISGDATSWSSATTVAFADSKVKVNSVTAASATGLIVNVTVGADAKLAATDVTVTDGTNMEVYKGAFTIKEPLEVTIDQTGGVPQGGIATLSIRMLDITTPLDPANLGVTLSSPGVAILGTPTPSDFSIQFQVEADVLAAPGAVDLVVSSGPSGSSVDSPLKSAFTIAARAPTALTSTAAGSGTIASAEDTALYQFTPADASQRFVMFTLGSPNGHVTGVAIPKSGKYADALSPGFGIRYGKGTTAADPIYVVVKDGLDPNTFGPGATPATVAITTFESACTAAAETAETAGANNDATAGAQSVATLPGLVNGTLGYGAVAALNDVDTYKIVVPAGKTTIHAATGGDAQTDTVIDVLDSTGTSVNGASDDFDFQEDYTVTGLTAGTYYVRVSPSQAGFFDPSHNAYQLFVELK